MKTRTITIAKNDIFFDVDAVTHILSRATESQNMRRADAIESDTGDDMAESIITRFADHRVAELKDRLSRFVQPVAEAVSSADGEISQGTGYEFAFYVEDAFQDALMDALAKDIQSYISNGVISDWYAANADPQASVYLNAEAPVFTRIVRHFASRKFPTRV